MIAKRYDTAEQETVNIPGSATPSGEQTLKYDALTPRVGIVYQPLFFTDVIIGGLPSTSKICLMSSTSKLSRIVEPQVTPSVNRLL